MCKKIDYIYDISIYVHIKNVVKLSDNKGFVQLLRLQSNLHSITPLFCSESIELENHTIIFGIAYFSLFHITMK